jgi:large subunit ribosomal protein L21
MFAVVKTGGKQYRVIKDQVILVEKLVAEKGASVDLDQVLMVGDEAGTRVGAPRVDGAIVTATVADQIKGEKLTIFKKRRRKNYRRTRGHRQLLTVLKVTEILPDGRA